MLAEGHPVTVEGLPAHLAAFAAVEQLPAADGGLRDRTDRRGQLRYDKVWVRSPGPPPDKVSGSGLAERDLRWLASATSQRRGRRAEELAGPAGNSGLFRLLYQLDMSQARYRLGPLSGIEPRPDAQPTLDRWLSSLIAQDGELSRQLAAAVPAAAKAWAAEEAPRPIAAAAGDALTRAALTEDLCALARRLPADGLPLSVLADQTVHNTHGLDTSSTLGRLAARLAAAIAGLGQPANAADCAKPGKRSACGQTGSPVRSPAGTFHCIGHTPRPRSPPPTARLTSRPCSPWGSSPVARPPSSPRPHLTGPSGW